MKKCLLLLGVVATLALAAPAHSQYIYLSVGTPGFDDDAFCDENDVLNAGANTVNVYLQTDADAASNPVSCAQNAALPMSIFSYEVTLHAAGNGSVSYGVWQHNSTDLADYAQLRAPASGGGDHSVFFGKTFPPFNAPGIYRLGSIAVTATGAPTMALAITTGLGGFGTSFGSDCPGVSGTNTIKLGTDAQVLSGLADFSGTCGTAASTPTEQKTWAQIKRLYRE